MATASTIERAHSRAVGGKKDRCRKGKSCSATCISSWKQCLVEASGDISQQLGKFARSFGIKMPTREQDVRQYQSVYKRLREKLERAGYSREQDQYNDLSKKMERLQKIGLKLGVPEKEQVSYEKLLNKRQALEKSRSKQLNKMLTGIDLWMPEDFRKHRDNLIKLEERTRGKIGAVHKSEEMERYLTRLEKMHGDLLAQRVKDTAGTHEQEESRERQAIRKSIENSQKHIDNITEKAYQQLALLKGDEASSVGHYSSEIDKARSRALSKLNNEDRIKVIESLYKDYAYGASNASEARNMKETATEAASTLPKKQRDESLLPFRKLDGELGLKNPDPKIADKDLVMNLGSKLVEPHFKKIDALYTKSDAISEQIWKVEDKLTTGKDSLSEAKTQMLERRLDRMYQAKINYQLKASREFEAIRDTMLKTNLSDRKVDQLLKSFKREGPISSDSIKSIEEFIRMFNGRAFYSEHKESGVGSRPVTIIRGVTGRASAQPFSGSVDIVNNKRTIYHELAHMLEHTDSRIVKYAQQWRMKQSDPADVIDHRKKGGFFYPADFPEPVGKRTGTNPFGKNQETYVYKLKDMLKDDKYGDNEVAMVGRYMSPYMGKVYTGSSSTEVISMAVEMFSHPEKMAVLYDNHPDLFTYIAGLSQL